MKFYVSALVGVIIKVIVQNAWCNNKDILPCNKYRFLPITDLFYVITQRLVVISYRRFGTNYRSLPHGSFLFLNPEELVLIDTAFN